MTPHQLVVSKMYDTEKYLNKLELSNIYREPVIRTILDKLKLSPGSKNIRVRS